MRSPPCSPTLRNAGRLPSRAAAASPTTRQSHSSSGAATRRRGLREVKAGRCLHLMCVAAFGFARQRALEGAGARPHRWDGLLNRTSERTHPWTRYHASASLSLPAIAQAFPPWRRLPWWPAKVGGGPSVRTVQCRWTLWRTNVVRRGRRPSLTTSLNNVRLRRTRSVARSARSLPHDVLVRAPALVPVDQSA